MRNCKDYADHISSTGIRFHLYAHVFSTKIDLQPNPISGFVIFVMKIHFFELRILIYFGDLSSQDLSLSRSLWYHDLRILKPRSLIWDCLWDRINCSIVLLEHDSTVHTIIHFWTIQFSDLKSLYFRNRLRNK